MHEKEIEGILKIFFEDSLIHVEGDGSHFDAVLVSEKFNHLNTLKRQQLVYKSLGDGFSTGMIHALSMKTYTFEEWENLTHKPVDFT